MTTRPAEPQPFDRTWLNRATTDFAERNDAGATAAALIGLLSALADNEDRHSREDQLNDELIECEDTINRVRELARYYRSHPHDKLKPIAFPHLADLIDGAIDGDAPEPVKPEEKA